MPGVDDITGQLSEAADALSKAQLAAGQTGQAIGRVQSDAGARGYRAMAANLGQLNGPVRQIMDMLRAVGNTLGPLADAVRKTMITDLSPQQIVSSLTSVAQQIGTASTATDNTKRTVANLKNSITGALRGGDPSRLLATANGIDTELDRLRDRLHAAGASTKQMIDDTRQLGNFPPGAA